jgi:hypothetical protein
VTDDGVYVYAIVRADAHLSRDLGGVGSPARPLRMITEGSVGAVVSEAPPALRARRRDLLAHQELLVALGAGGAVLPMRFGMVARDEEAVRGQLLAAGAQLLADLDRLTGRAEMNVKALPAVDALAALVREDQGIRRLREAARRNPGYEENLRLGEAVAAALSRRAAEAGRLLVRELTPLAHAVVAGPPVADCEVNVSFLVDGAAVDSFRTAFERFAARHGDHARLRVAGPLPCYSFVGGDAEGSLAPVEV